MPVGFSVLFLSLWTISILGISSLLNTSTVDSSRILRLETSNEEPSSSTDEVTSSNVNLLSPNNGTAENGLQIAWLMSFPNSGTSYTSRLVREASRTMTATNYADEEYHVDSPQEAVYPDQPMGPFWIHQENFGIPNRYVLTKTHCGLRCGECPPEEYAETTYSFRRKCAFTKWLDDHKHAKYGNYDFARVKKAVHLIRNPFDNVVSRFHLLTAKKHNQQYAATKHGFLEYCLHIDGMFTRNEIKYAHFRNVHELRDLWLGTYGTTHRRNLLMNCIVPCHAEFCKYIEWHNLAFHTTNDMELDTLVVHYDAYPQAGETVLEFLELDHNGTFPEFQLGKTYKDFFQPSEQKIVEKAFEYMASTKTWSHVKKYFQEDKS